MHLSLSHGPGAAVARGRASAKVPSASAARMLVARANVLSSRYSSFATSPVASPRSHASNPASRGSALVVSAGKKDKKMVKKLEKEIQTLQKQIMGTMSSIEAELEARASSPPLPDDYHQIKAERDALLGTVEVLTGLLRNGGAAPAATAPPAAAAEPPVPAPQGADPGVGAEAAHGVIASLQAEAEAAVAAAHAKADESTENARALAAEVIKLRKQLSDAPSSNARAPAVSPAAAPAATSVPAGESPLAGVLGSNYVGSSAAASVAAAVASITPPAARTAPTAPVVTEDGGAGDDGPRPEPSDESAMGPRPALTAGDDDLYWVGRLQAALYVEGFFCGEEETEDIVFGARTEDALRTYQACTDGLEETGFVDDATWEKLLGPAPPPPGGAPAAAEEEGGAPAPVDEATMGPRPALMAGSDDIYWVGRLHAALFDQGYFCGEEDTEDIVFGARTEDALRTYQVCTGLEESGFTDDATWEALLGPAPAAAPAAPAPPEAAAATNGTSAAPEATNGSAAAQTKARLDDAGKVVRPVLGEGDGGAFVHELQTALNAQGYFCGDEDCQWWHFGYTTEQALKTFQSCMGLPETGTTFQDVWTALLGDAAHEMPPDPTSDDSGYSMDLTSGEGRGVYLIGEDRWEDPARLEKDKK